MYVAVAYLSQNEGRCENWEKGHNKIPLIRGTCEQQHPVIVIISFDVIFLCKSAAILATLIKPQKYVNVKIMKKDR